MTLRRGGIQFGLAAMLWSLSFSVEAQQPTKVARIGYLLSGDSSSESDRFESLRLALRELGYIEGQNITIEYRYAEGKQERLPELADELVRLKVDILVVAGGIRGIRGGQECDQNDSHHYDGRRARSCGGRLG